MTDKPRDLPDLEDDALMTAHMVAIESIKRGEKPAQITVDVLTAYLWHIEGRPRYLPGTTLQVTPSLSDWRAVRYGEGQG